MDTAPNLSGRRFRNHAPIAGDETELPNRAIPPTRTIRTTDIIGKLPARKTGNFPTFSHAVGWTVSACSRSTAHLIRDRERKSASRRSADGDKRIKVRNAFVCVQCWRESPIMQTRFLMDCDDSRIAAMTWSRGGPSTRWATLYRNANSRTRRLFTCNFARKWLACHPSSTRL